MHEVWVGNSPNDPWVRLNRDKIRCAKREFPHRNLCGRIRARVQYKQILPDSWGCSSFFPHIFLVVEKKFQRCFFVFTPKCGVSMIQFWGVQISEGCNISTFRLGLQIGQARRDQGWMGSSWKLCLFQMEAVFFWGRKIHIIARHKMF